MELTPVDRRAQDAYASWLDLATRVGFVLSAVAFLLYAAGIMPAYVAPADVPGLWQLPARRFAAAIGAPQGWDWLGLLGYGDYLCLAAVALFAAVTAACYARLLLLFVRAGAWLDAALAATQLAVLAVAASGVLAGGG